MGKTERNRGTKRRHDKPERADYKLVRVGTGYVLLVVRVGTGYVLMGCKVVRWGRQGVIRR